MNNLFAYGTLRLPEVIEALLGKKLESEPFQVTNFIRKTMRGQIYPGVIHSKGAIVDGSLYVGIDDYSMHVLDTFEDEVYERQLISVNSSINGIVEAKIYVVPETHVSILGENDWNIEEFRAGHLASYVDMCQRFILEQKRKGVI